MTPIMSPTPTLSLVMDKPYVIVVSLQYPLTIKMSYSSDPGLQLKSATCWHKAKEKVK